MSETMNWEAVAAEIANENERLTVELAEARKDAERYRLISGTKCNSLNVNFNEHAASYVTAKDWIENCLPSNFERVDPEELQRMKDSNSIWQVQIYPNTPSGFNSYYGATLDAAVTAAQAEGGGRG